MSHVKNVLYIIATLACLVITNTVHGSVDNNLHFVKPLIARWLDVLSSQQLPSLDFIQSDADMDLLVFTDTQGLQQSVQQRVAAFSGGEYILIDLQQLASEAGIVQVQMVLDWVKQEQGIVKEKSRIVSQIQFVINESGEPMISAVSESFALPTDGLEAKLRC